jgi:hypothetical protein
VGFATVATLSVVRRALHIYNNTPSFFSIQKCITVSSLGIIRVANIQDNKVSFIDLRGASISVDQCSEQLDH